MSLYLPVCLPRCLPVCNFFCLSNGLYFRQSVRTFPCFVGLLCCKYARKMRPIYCHTCNWPDRQQKRGGKAKKETKSTNQQAYYDANRTNQIYTYVYVFVVVVECFFCLFACLLLLFCAYVCLIVCLFGCYFVFKKILKQEKFRYKTNKHHPTHPEKAKPVIRQTSLEKDFDKPKIIL